MNIVKYEATTLTNLSSYAFDTTIYPHIPSTMSTTTTTATINLLLFYHHTCPLFQIQSGLVRED